MNWKQLVLPRPLHSSFKRARLAKMALAKPWLTMLLRLGWPKPIARYLGARRHSSQIVRRKQGIVYVATEDCFLRFAVEPRAIDKLEREFAMWQLLRAKGLAAILPHAMALYDAAGGKVLESDRLQPIRKEDHVMVTLPIIEMLISAAEPITPQDLPPTIEAGLRFARAIADRGLPGSFAEESEIRDCFKRPLLTGISHRDLHFRNVMRDNTGRPTLTDLKSCEPDRIIAVDLLAFACKYLQAQGKQTLVDAAFAAQQCNWQIPEVEPILAFVDLPRALWGQIFLLHAIGLHALKHASIDQSNRLLRALLLRLLAKDWRTVS